MESTSIYRTPVWRVLEPYVSELKLVNPYFIKQLPGKKSDVKDAEWIATCLLKDLIKGSYVPGDIIQHLRQYDRRISDLNAECVRKLGKLDAALQRCNIRISCPQPTVKATRRWLNSSRMVCGTQLSWQRQYTNGLSTAAGMMSSSLH